MANRPRLVVDLYTQDLQWATKALASSNKLTQRELVLDALGLVYPTLRSIVATELGREDNGDTELGVDYLAPERELAQVNDAAEERIPYAQ